MNSKFKHLTDLIYQGVLGLTREEFIEQAKQRTDSGHFTTDEDEAARDCLSADALKAISLVEKVFAVFIKIHKMIPPDTVVLDIASRERVETIWYEKEDC
jgi:hypothetical protein